MTLDEQEEYLNIINDEFTTMKGMLDSIHKNITQYPVGTQLEFIKFIKHVIFEAWQDATNKDDNFLNNYKENDKIEI